MLWKYGLASIEPLVCCVKLGMIDKLVNLVNQYLSIVLLKSLIEEYVSRKTLHCPLSERETFW